MTASHSVGLAGADGGSADIIASNVDHAPVESDEVLKDGIEGWARISGRRVRPDDTRILKSTRKSRVFRLMGAGPHATDVVAKRRREPAMTAERVVLGRIAHFLPVPMIRLYGRNASDGFTWHYLEDGGSTHLDVADPTHMLAFSGWLADVHRALQGVRPDALPDHSADRYAIHLAATRDRLDVGLANHAVDHEQRLVLHDIARLIDGITASWPDLVEIVSVLPDTLVHGDLQRKNILMRDGRQKLAVLPIDWEMSGWGTPAADVAFLVQPEERVAFLERYRLCISDSAISREGLARAAAVGRVFRLIAAMDWATYDQLGWSSIRKPVKRLQAYGLGIREALDDAGVRWRPMGTPR